VKEGKKKNPNMKRRKGDPPKATEKVDLFYLNEIVLYSFPLFEGVWY
jgi:hypothetical protein